MWIMDIKPENEYVRLFQNRKKNVFFFVKRICGVGSGVLQCGLGS